MYYDFLPPFAARGDGFLVAWMGALEVPAPEDEDDERHPNDPEE
jgi:hypothetical protein